MAVSQALGQGPEFAERAHKIERLVDKLKSEDWEFDAVPEAFATNSKADVVAKEIVHIHDGRVMTRVGRLVMGGYGSTFNLMGPIAADSRLRVSDGAVVDVVNDQLPGSGLDSMAAFHELGGIQRVRFFNYGMFYRLEDLIFWLMLHGSGCYPSTLQYMIREFKAGKIVQNVMYQARRPASDGRPNLMQSECLSVSFESPVVEWMEKPLYGGFASETIHAETLLTVEQSEVSHPYLELVDEGRVEFGNRSYHAKRFKGTSQKDGVRGPNVPEEGPRQSAQR